MLNVFSTTRKVVNSSIQARDGAIKTAAIFQCSLIDKLPLYNDCE